MIMARSLPRSPHIFQNHSTQFSRNSTPSFTSTSTSRESNKSALSANRAEFDDSYRQYSQLLQTIHQSQSQSSPGSVSFTSKDKRDFSHNLHASFSSNRRTNLSIEEIVCDEIDDVLPKTDYTYVRTASYSPKYSRDTKYISPNMSRRRIHGSQPVFLSDDEDDFTEETPGLNIVPDSKVYKMNEEPEREPSESGSTKSKSTRGRRRTIVTSTPRTPHVNQISAHDHYYSGMLLRSGSHIKGVQSYLNEKEAHVMKERDKTKDSKDHLNTAVTRRNRNQRHSFDSPSHPGLYASGLTSLDVDTRSQRMNARNLVTTITTTTTTTYEENQKALASEEASEKKLRLDQKQTEKHDNPLNHFHTEKLGHSTAMWKEEKGHDQSDKSQTEKVTSHFNRTEIDKGDFLRSSRQAKSQYKLQHLYGLDYDEEISDEDGLDWTDYQKTSTQATHDQQRIKTSKNTRRSQNDSMNKQRSFDTDSQIQSHINRQSTLGQGWGYSFYLWIATCLTSVKTAVSTSSSDAGLVSGVQSASAVLLNSASLSARWFMHWIASVATWLVTKSATILLWDIEVKQRRRRGCCCFFLPLLFLLPLFLLGGYYTRDVYQNAGSYLSNGKQVLSSSLSYLWFSTSADTKTSYIEVPPPSITPVTQAEAPQINMTHIYQYIQQTVIQAAALHRDDGPVGLTHEQVESIVGDLLAKHLDGLKANLEERIKALKVLIAKDGSSLSSLEGVITGMTEEIKATVQAHKTISVNMEQLKESIGSTNQKNTLEWQTAYEAQQLKILDLTQQISSLSSQNAALTAMLTNCCRNNTLPADNIRAQIKTILSQMGTEDYDNLTGLFAWTNGKFIERSEMDQKLDVLYTQIMDSLKVALSNIEQTQNVKSDAESHATIVAGIDELAVKNIIEDALIQFSADRVGMPDFALESAGGSVLSVRCSETFYKKTALVSVFGIPLWYTSNSPRTVIQPNVHPGECWAFKGDSGRLVLQLSHPIQITGFTLEHIPRSLAPRGDISSAPREFTVFGLASESDHLGVNLGNYTYEDNGKPIQLYSTQNHQSGIFQHVELRVLSNHGNKEYTCIYRFRVHGLP
ncbi:unnamed protein product [Lymnaea stagnalis]|uniref:SUN domain-containing protein n=1 Tax=Lymnaea stagnalis TaxID=6523 RepID=A0AAV2H0B3_LYMST